jgi:hydroxymethylpyrimidine/phosphomethylpyrimidine kinase
MTIAGSDSGGGAGIQADLKTFHAFSVYGASAITALTAQNTLGVQSIYGVPAGFVTAQINSVLSDIGADAVKTGMLSSAAIVEAVASALEQHPVRHFVLDPVMVAKGGARLLRADAEQSMKKRLIPLATLVTPNADEAEVLTGILPDSVASMRSAARALRAEGARAVLIKGGHVEAEPGVSADLLLDDDGELLLRLPRLEDPPTHGAGCTLSAAITALLASGRSLREAVTEAKQFLHQAFRSGGRPGKGAGHGCPDHQVRAT